MLRGAQRCGTSTSDWPDTHRVPAPSNTLSQRETDSRACKPRAHPAEPVTCLFPGKENPSWPSVPPCVRPPIPPQPLKCTTTALLLTLETCLQVQPSQKQQNWHLLVKQCNSKTQLPKLKAALPWYQAEGSIIKNWKHVNKSPIRELPFRRDLLSYLKKIT